MQDGFFRVPGFKNKFEWLLLSNLNQELNPVQVIEITILIIAVAILCTLETVKFVTKLLLLVGYNCNRLLFFCFIIIIIIIFAATIG